MENKLIRVAEYEGRILIEYGDSVPEWVDMGLGPLDGPFASVAEAQAIIESMRGYLRVRGYRCAK